MTTTRPPLVVANRDDARTFDPDRAVVIIGRGEDADVVVLHPRVSKEHARVVAVDGGWDLEDLGSRHGTWVDGARIDRRRLAGVTSVHVGPPGDGAELTLTVQSSAQPTAPAKKPPFNLPPRRRLGGGLVEAGGVDPGQRSSVHRAVSTVRIGRAEDNDIVVLDLAVSRHHAELRPSGGSYELVDLGSKRGTFLNGHRVTQARANEGDLIGLGHVVFRLLDGTLEEYADVGDVTLDAAGLTVVTEEGTAILDDVSLSLPPRSVTAVVGTSGSGKSTLIRALTAFRPADRGTVLYNGRDLYDAYDELRSRIGYVPQDDILHDQLTVRQALTYAAELRFPADTSEAERRGRVDEVMGELGIANRADLPIHRLSGGQRKRVNVALELLTRPTLLFLDEPTSGLDPGFERSVMRLLRELADSGRTVVVITHSVQSLDLTDRVVVLAPGGRLAYAGPPGEALDYFGAATHADLFEDIEQRREHDWAGRFRASATYQRYVAEPLARRETAVARRRIEGPAAQPPRLDSQWRTLVRRYLAVIAADRTFLLALFATAPLLGLLIMAVTPAGTLSEPEIGNASEAMSVLLILVLTATAYGAIDAVREVVKERPVLRRELGVGLSPSAYLGSKVAVLSGIVAVQVVTLTLVGLLGQRPPPGVILPVGMLELMAVLVLAGVAGMALGLLVSSAVASADRAVVLLLLIIVPQLVLSGALPLPPVPGLEQASYVTPMRWATAAAAVTTRLQEGVLEYAEAYGPGADCDDLPAIERRFRSQSPPGTREAINLFGGTDVFERLCDPLWEPTGGQWMVNVGMLLLLTGVALGATQLFVRRVGVRGGV